MNRVGRKQELYIIADLPVFTYVTVDYYRVKNIPENDENAFLLNDNNV